MKSAPKGNFNCLTRPDFLRGGSAGWGEMREAAPRGNRGQEVAENGDQSSEIPVSRHPRSFCRKDSGATPTVSQETFANHICSQNGAENKNII